MELGRGWEDTLLDAAIETVGTGACRLVLDCDPKIYSAIADGIPLVFSGRDAKAFRALLRKHISEQDPGLTGRALEARIRKEEAYFATNRPPVPFLQSARDTVLDGEDILPRESLEEIARRACDALRSYAVEHCTFGLEDCFLITDLEYTGREDGKAVYGEDGSGWEKMGGWK